jgi:hypothetical protein
MSNQRETKPFVPLFMIEPYVRTALQKLYVGTLGASSNAELLLEKNPWNIEWNPEAEQPEILNVSLW